jgi:hypothetical protein
MGPSNLEYSADIFGACAAEVEGEFEDSICLMFSGCSADMSTRFVRKAQTWDEMNRLGENLAEQIVKAGNSSKRVKGNSILSRIEKMTLPFRKIPTTEEAQEEYEKAVAKYDASSGIDKNSPETLLARSLLEGAQAQLFLSGIGGWKPLFGTGSAELELQAIRVGDIIICGLPGEFFEEREIVLREAALPHYGFIIGYANGYWGYIVPPSEAGKGGYETMMSPLEPSMEPKIIRRAEDLIRQIKN